MACTRTLQNIDLSCEGGLGGVKRILAANLDDIASVTIANGSVSAITMATGKSFVELKAPKSTSNYETSFTRDETSGAAYWTTTIHYQTNKMTPANWEAINELSKANLALIVVDANNNARYFGAFDYAAATAATGSTGTAWTDGNNYTMDFQVYDLDLPPFVASTVDLDGLLTAAA